MENKKIINEVYKNGKFSYLLNEIRSGKSVPITKSGSKTSSTTNRSRSSNISSFLGMDRDANLRRKKERAGIEGGSLSNKHQKLINKQQKLANKQMKQQMRQDNRKASIENRGLKNDIKSKKEGDRMVGKNMQADMATKYFKTGSELQANKRDNERRDIENQGARNEMEFKKKKIDATTRKFLEPYEKGQILTYTTKDGKRKQGKFAGTLSSDPNIIFISPSQPGLGKVQINKNRIISAN